ncbi:MAG: outer membrane protein assembly factor BamE [Gammaproteobacteria bacterium]|nr:outer membrane protein assembly factor BamE [Gammaproteobacteria bacterium]
MSPVRLILIIAAAVLVTGCIRPYKLDIQQGNVVSQKEVSQLERGMNKREVRYVMGTPLVIDPFHGDRWEYFYSFKAGNQSKANRRRITLVFADDRLDYISGDVALAEGGRGADDGSAEAVASGTRVTAPIKKEKKGFFKRMLDKIRR